MPEKIIEVRDASSANDIEIVQQIWAEYWTTLGFSPTFQNFEQERLSFPGEYARPTGRLLLAFLDGMPVGTIAMRRIDDRRCEGKRLYVRPEARGHGVAKALLQALSSAAREANYRELHGDTMRSMSAALSLYQSIGFTEVERPPASPSPSKNQDVHEIYLKLIL